MNTTAEGAEELQRREDAKSETLVNCLSVDPCFWLNRLESDYWPV